MASQESKCFCDGISVFQLSAENSFHSWENKPFTKGAMPMNVVTSLAEQQSASIKISIFLQQYGKQLETMWPTFKDIKWTQWEK